MAIKNIEYFKNSISIIEFMKTRPDLGFTFKREGKYVKAYIPIEDSSGNPVYSESNKSLKKEHIIICRIEKNNNKQEVYFDVNNFDKSRPKSIIDFVSEYVFRSQNVDFKKVLGTLKQYEESNKFIHIDNSSVDIITQNNDINKPKNTISKYSYDFPNEKTFQYLKGRGIDKSVLSSPIFIGTYGSYTDPEKGISGAPAFPLTLKNKRVTLQYINYNSQTKSHSSKLFLKDIDRDAALYRSNYLKENNTVILIESPEKAMAHYQLYSNEMKQNKVSPLYLSSCGQITKKDLNEVLDYSEDKSINKFILAFDNDDAGNKYTLNTLLHFNFENLKIDSTSIKTENNSFYKIILTIENKVNLNSLKNHLESKKIKHDTNDNNIVISGNYNDLIKQLKNPNILIHESITCDFLDDLNSGNKLPFNFNNNANTLTL
jgi:hypothetical protein